MKIKDGLLSASLGYIVVNLPVWVEHDCTWLFWLGATALFWDILIRIEEFQQKRKRAHRAGAQDGRKRKFITV